jgi:hypothetical protein
MGALVDLPRARRINMVSHTPRSAHEERDALTQPCLPDKVVREGPGMVSTRKMDLGWLSFDHGRGQGW